MWRIKSSTVIVKLNGNCYSCKGYPYVFGIYLSNKEENSDLGFDGRHRICMRLWDLLPYGPIESLGAMMLDSIYQAAVFQGGSQLCQGTILK